ncbi:MAG: hypothetical protein ACRDJ9_22105 [Dehalococcoidia bacterium]
MMAMLPPIGSAGVATKEDLALLATREEMRNELHQQTRLFVTWLLTANATMTAIFGLFVGMLAAFD